jgi:hypothetical protein
MTENRREQKAFAEGMQLGRTLEACGQTIRALLDCMRMINDRVDLGSEDLARVNRACNAAAEALGDVMDHLTGLGRRAA